MKQCDGVQTEKKHNFISGVKREVIPSECASGTPQHFIQYYISQQKQIDKREQEKESIKEEDGEEEENELIMKNLGENDISLKCLEIRQEELKECFEELQKYISPEQKLVTENRNRKKSKSQSIFGVIFLLLLEVAIVYFTFFVDKM